LGRGADCHGESGMHVAASRGRRAGGTRAARFACRRNSGRSVQMKIVLISTYDLGHSPFGVASAKAWLARDGHEVRSVDLAVERFDERTVRDADAVAFFLPMHTATRLAVPVIGRVRRVNPRARLAAFGLYAPLNQD